MERPFFSTMIQSEVPGLSLNVAKRIKQLNRIGMWLEGNKDEYNLLPTIKAINKAYRKKELVWNLGLVLEYKLGKIYVFDVLVDQF